MEFVLDWPSTLNSLFFVFKFSGQVPKDVQDAALAAIDGPSEKKKKT